MTRNKTLIRIAVLAALATAATGAQAQQVLEEIVVTATKREQSVQDVAISIAAFDENSFRALTRGTLEGLAAQIPNIQAYATNSFLQSVHIRGIGLNEFQGQYDSPVAQHIDEVYISKPWMIARRQYDVARVEVLKGPQGTLFGRNTTGGALNYYTNAPQQEFDARVEFAADQHERYRVGGAVTGGLTDRLSGRFSFNTEFGDGGPQFNEFTDKEHGKPKLYDLRGQLQWDGEALKVRLLVHGGRDKSEKVAWKGPGLFNFGAPGLCPQALTGEIYKNPASCAKFAGFATLAGFPGAEFEPADEFTINQNTPPSVDDTFYGGYLRVAYDMGWAELTSITAYEYYERRHREDSQSDIFDSTSTHYYDQMNQFSQELRLSGDLRDGWRYVAGVFFEHDKLDQVDGSDLSQQPIPAVVPPFADQFFAQFGQKVQSAAVFANTEFDVSPALRLTAGLRYTHDKNEVNDVLLGLGQKPITGKEKFVTPCLITTFVGGPVGSPACPFLGPVAPLYNADRTDSNVSGAVGLEWRPQADVLVYGNVKTGYRAGGYSLPFAGAATDFEPEKIVSQELGVKSRWLDGRLQLNAAIFHFKIKDVQVNVDDPVSPLVPITRNIGDQENLGAELEVEWAPADHWVVRQGLGWLDAEYKNTKGAQITTYAGPVPLEGKRPVNSPDVTYNGSITFRHPVAANWEGTVGVDYRWVAKRYLEATNQPFDRADEYWLANARASLASADKRWEFSLYGTNITNTKYLTYINNIGFFALEVFGEKRTVGATAAYNFK